MKEIKIKIQNMNKKLKNSVTFNEETFEFLNHDLEMLVETDLISEIISVVDVIVYNGGMFKDAKKLFEEEYKVQYLEEGNILFETDSYKYNLIPNRVA